MTKFKPKYPLLTIIQAYKYNGWLYHAWQPIYIIDQNNDYLFCASKYLYILTSKKDSDICYKHLMDDTNTFWFFFEKEWFNLKITINKENHNIIYYINVASPFYIENGIIKYIDFDLDYRCVLTANSKIPKWHILDVKEFEKNQVEYNYSHSVLNTINKAKERIEKLLEAKYFITNFSYGALTKCMESLNFNHFEPVALSIDKNQNKN